MTADYHSLNAMLNLYDEDGNIQFDKDHEAVDAFLAEHVAPRMIRFESTRERLRYLVDHHYYEYDVFSKYSPSSSTRSMRMPTHCRTVSRRSWARSSSTAPTR